MFNIIIVIVVVAAALRDGSLFAAPIDDTD